MPFGQTTDPNGDWFSQNGPEWTDNTGGTGITSGTGGGVTAAQVAEVYQQLLGRPPENQQVVDSWVNGLGSTGGIQAIVQAISSSPEAQAYHSTSASRVARGDPANANPTTQSSSLPSSGRTTDPAAIKAQIAQWASMPGADPSLANDPDYWVQAITSRGGLGTDNSQYWQDASVGDNAFFRNPGRESGSTLGQMGAPPPGVAATPAGPAPTATTYQGPNAPAYSNYTPPPAPDPIAFVAPTAEQARNTPGYQSAIDQGNQGLQRSAAARGGLLSGGALKDIGTYNIGMADQNYQNVYTNALNANQLANSNQLNQWQANVNANLGAGSLNLSGTNQAFQNQYQPTWQAYLSNVGQQQFGANYGLSANNQYFNQGLASNQNSFNQNLSTNQFNLGKQNQFWNQGFSENQNAYNQYNTSQNNAFSQWLQTVQLGNPGNPYA